jgi:hypothetical protein
VTTDNDSQPGQITDAQLLEVVRLLLEEPDVVLYLFDRAVRDADPWPQRVVRDYLRVVSATIAQWHRAPGRP